MSYYSVVTFKDFLYNTFNSLTKDSIWQFQKKLTNGLPFFNTGTKLNTIWNCEEKGFWYASETECWFFENNGTFHLLSSDIGENHYQIFKDLYNSSISDNDCPIKIPEPLESDSFLISNDNHFSLPKNVEMNYIKFKMPTDGYGSPASFIHYYEARILGKNDILECKQFIDQITWIFSTLKKLAHPFPIVGVDRPMPVMLLDRLKTDDKHIFYKFSKFDSSIGDAIENQLSNFEYDINNTSENIISSDLKSEYISYARLKWQALKS